MLHVVAQALPVFLLVLLDVLQRLTYFLAYIVEDGVVVLGELVEEAS